MKIQSTLVICGAAPAIEPHNGAAAAFIRFLSGSFSGVVGLPLFETAQMLRGFGWPLP